MFVLSLGCSERDLQLSLLSVGAQPKSDFTITNAIAEDQVAPNASESEVVISADCSSTVVGVEVQDVTTREWKKVEELNTSSKVDCVSSGKASITLPIETIAPFESSLIAGAVAKEFQLRYGVKSKTGPVSYVYKTLTTVFSAPSVTLDLQSVNASNASNYTISGTCSLPGQPVDISGPYEENVTCSANRTYSVSKVIPGGVNDGTYEVVVSHRLTTPARTWAQAKASVLVDRVVPVVSITTPVQNFSLTGGNIPANGKITFSGGCENGLPVEIKAGSNVLARGACANQIYTIDVALPEGVLALNATQTDSAGNLGLSNTRNGAKDTVAPAAVVISGVLPVNTSGTPTNSLPASMARVVYQMNAESVSYDGTISEYASGTPQLCSTTNSTVGYIDFSGCSLSHGKDYYVFVTATDAAANKGPAGSGFKFSTVAAPKVTSVVTTTADGSYKAGVEISITINFDKAVTWPSNSVPNLALNVGSPTATADYLSGKDTSSIVFKYVVAGTHNVDKLKVVSFNGTVTLRDYPGVIADKSAAADGLSSRSIRIDNMSPNTVSLSLGATPTKMSLSPTVSYSLPTDPQRDQLTPSLRIFKGNDIVVTRAGFLSGSAVLGANFEPSTTYDIKLLLTDPAGNTSESVTTWTSFACPENYLYIANPTRTHLPFCVAKYESRQGTGDEAVSAPTPTPWNNITYASALQACDRLNGSGEQKYKMLTNEHWTLIADLVAQQTSNYYNGVIHRGNDYGKNALNHTGPMDADDDAPYAPGGVSNYPGNRRYLDLPYSQKIWDFTGNLWEMVELDVTAYGVPDQTMLETITSTNYPAFYSRYGATQVCPRTDCGFGSVLQLSSSTDTLVARGGSYQSAVTTSFLGNPITSTLAGIFATRGGLDRQGMHDLVGFRCVYEP